MRAFALHLAEVLQQAAPRELGELHGHAGVERMPLGGQRLTALRAERARAITTSAQAGLQLLHARLIGADFGLRAFCAGAQTQRAGIVERTAPACKLGVALGQTRFQRLQRGIGGYCGGSGGARLTLCKTSSAFADERGGALELLAQACQLASTVLGRSQFAQGLLQGLSRRLLLGGR